MHVYWNFYCSPAKKYGSDPHFFCAGDATEDISASIIDQLARFQVWYFSGEGFTETHPQTQSRFALDSGIALNSLPQHVYFLSNRRGLDQTLFPPTSPSWLRHAATVRVSSQDPIQGLYRPNITKLDWNILLIKSMTASWKNFLKKSIVMNASYRNIQCMEFLHQICFHFSPKCTKIVGGWGSAQTPLGELTALPQLLWAGMKIW